MATPWPELASGLFLVMLIWFSSRRFTGSGAFTRQGTRRWTPCREPAAMQLPVTRTRSFLTSLGLRNRPRFPYRGANSRPPSRLGAPHFPASPDRDPIPHSPHPLDHTSVPSRLPHSQLPPSPPCLNYIRQIPPLRHPLRLPPSHIPVVYPPPVYHPIPHPYHRLWRHPRSRPPRPPRPLISHRRHAQAVLLLPALQPLHRQSVLGEHQLKFHFPILFHYPLHLRHIPPRNRTLGRPIQFHAQPLPAPRN